MPINYSIGQRLSNPSKNKEKKVYALAQHNRILSLSELAQHIARHGSVFDRSVIEGVLIRMVECMREQMLEGNGIQLGDMGTFYLSLSSEPTELASDFTARNITDVKVRWTPGAAFRNMRKDAHFREVNTRKTQQKQNKK